MNNFENMLKLFQFVQRQFAILGLIPNQKYPINTKILMALGAYWLDNALNCVYVSVAVDNFIDYANSIFIICATTTIATCFTLSLINSNGLFILIDSAEKIADHGKNDLEKKTYNRML